ncbi:hypothetical protein Droror1_Dr00024170 [Drosera rotundifolia]
MKRRSKTMTPLKQVAKWQKTMTEQPKETKTTKNKKTKTTRDHELDVGNDKEMVEEKVDEEMVEERNVEEKTVEDLQDIVQGTLQAIELQLSQEEGDEGDDDNENDVADLVCANWFGSILTPKDGTI